MFGSLAEGSKTVEDIGCTFTACLVLLGGTASAQEPVQGFTSAGLAWVSGKDLRFVTNLQLVTVQPVDIEWALSSCI